MKLLCETCETCETSETTILCETFGFDIIIIETVGVGQSEIFGHSISDCFVLLTLPKSGDEMQAIKKGILEFLKSVWLVPKQVIW